MEEAGGKKCDETFKQEIVALVRQHSPLMYRAAYSVTRNREDAEDIVQDLFLKLIQGQVSSDFRKNPAGYLYRAAMNAAISAVRLRARENRADVDVGSLEIRAPTNDAHLEKRIAHLRVAMAKMKPEIVETLNLFYKEDLGCPDIARIRGRPLRAVWMDLCRGRAQLKKLIRMQENDSETKQNEPQKIPRPDLADGSAT